MSSPRKFALLLTEEEMEALRQAGSIFSSIGDHDLEPAAELIDPVLAEIIHVNWRPKRPAIQERKFQIVRSLTEEIGRALSPQEPILVRRDRVKEVKDDDSEDQAKD